MIIRLTIKRLLSKKFSTAFLILALSIVLTLFFTFKTCLDSYKKSLAAANDESILLAGSTPNYMSIIESSHLFKKTASSNFPVKSINQLKEFGEVISLNIGFTAFQKPIVGTESRYFRLKDLKIAEGSYFLKIGECVLGANIAKELDLNLGDSFVNDPSSSFDISKSNPVKLKVCGILAESNTPNDHAIFTNLETSWVLEGIGHSHHPDEENDVDSSVTDLSSGTLKHLHFHGDPNSFPLTGAIIFPEDDINKAKLLALSLNNKIALTIVDPVAQIQEVYEKLSNIDTFFKFLFFMMLTALTLVIGILIFQAANLRSKEKEIYQTLGVPKSFFYKSIVCEWLLILSVSLLFGALISLSLESVTFDIFSFLS